MRIRWLVSLTVALLAGANSGSAQGVADLSLSVSGPNLIQFGSSVIYTLTVSNAGPAMATGVVISNQIPTNYNVTSVSAGQVVIKSGLLTVGLHSVPAGQSITFNVDAQVRSQFIGPGASVNPIDLVRAQLTNAFTVSANETDPNPADNSATATVEVDSLFPGSPVSFYDVQDLQLTSSNRISLSFSPAPEDSVNPYEAPGFYNFEIDSGLYGYISYGVYFSGSPGDVVFLAGTNASFSATTAMTNWLAVVRFSNPDDPVGAHGYPATQDQAFFPLSAIDADGFTSFTLFPNVIYVTGTETVSNGFITVAASYDEVAYGPFGEPDYYSVTLTASHAPLGLRLRASAAPEPVVVGSNLVYSLTVTNAMTRLATGVVVSNRIPASVNFVSATGGSISTNNGVLLIQLGQLSPGAGTAVQVIVQPAVVSILTNLFRAYCDQPDLDLTNGYATVISTVNGVATPDSADVSLSINWPQSVQFGNDAIYTITLSNAGPSAATGVVVSNQIPAGLDFVSATGGATPNNGVLLVNVGALAAGATSSIQIVEQLTFQLLPRSLSTGTMPVAYWTNGFEVFANETDPVPFNNSTNVVPAGYAPIPGTPITWNNPGGSVVVVSYGGEAGTPVSIATRYGKSNKLTNAFPGDVVTVLDPNGGLNPTNWGAVVRFFNPSDPAGTIGLPATDYETYLAASNGSNSFASFHLLPDVFYFAQSATLTLADIVTDGVVNATVIEFGPEAGIFAGQEGIILYSALLPTTTTITAPAPGQQVSNAAFTVTGTTAAAGGQLLGPISVTNVYVQVNGGAWKSATTANGWTNWSAAVTLTPGSNTVMAYAVDTFLGTASATNSVTFYYVTNPPATVDLSLSAGAAPDPVFVGSNLLYSLTVSNAGPATATGVVIGNHLPANVHFDYATGVSAVTSTNGVLLLNLSPLAAGNIEQVQITVQPNVSGSITNQFQVSSSQGDLAPADNSATVVSTVADVGGPLLLTISYSPAGNAAIVSWTPTVTGWTLQTNNHLDTGEWGDYAGPVINNQATNSLPTGNVFFRLTHP